MTITPSKSPGRPLLPTTYTWWIRPKKHNDDKEDPVEDKPPETKPSRRHQRRHSKSRHTKENNTGTGENNTSDDAEDNEDPVGATSEQDEQAIHEDSEDSNYLPLSEEEESLGNEDFIVPEEPLEQERLKRRLIATARSLKKKQLQLQVDQDMLNDRWTEVLAAEEYGLSGPAKSYPKRRLLT